MNQQKILNVPKLFLGHAEVVPQFVDKGLADLMSEFSLIGADRLNVLLIQHDVGRTRRHIKDTPLRRRDTMKDG